MEEEDEGYSFQVRLFNFGYPMQVAQRVFLQMLLVVRVKVVEILLNVKVLSRDLRAQLPNYLKH